MKGSIVVFTPHPDDEVLGCGGTIVKRIKEGYDVYIVFMTDGGSSHSKRPTELKAVRQQEAKDASRILGVDQKNLFFLNAQVGYLGKQKKETTKKVCSILTQLAPVQVYYPDVTDVRRDHRATNNIVESSIGRLSYRPVTYQYVIWGNVSYLIWDKLKRVSPPLRIWLYHLLRIWLYLPLRIWLYIRTKRRRGHRLMRIDISQFLLLKRKALEQYKSQTNANVRARLYGSEDYPVLPESFLKKFLKGYEEFYV